jgi:hypothetical protein
MCRNQFNIPDDVEIEVVNPTSYVDDGITYYDFEVQWFDGDKRVDLNFALPLLTPEYTMFG